MPLDSGYGIEDKNAKNNPSFECSDYKAMKPSLAITETLWGGTLEIRNSGLLKAMPKEKPDEFRNRLESSVFYNEFQRTVESGVGMVFKSDPTPVDKGKLPPKFAAIMEDVDLKGNDLATFLRERFTEAWRDGHSYIYVEAQQPYTDENGDPIQMRLDQLQDWRPWAVGFTASQAINWVTIDIGGKQYLYQITFKYCLNVPDGEFGSVEQERYVVLNPGRFREYVETKTEKGDDYYAIIKDYQTGLSEIPLTVVYGRKTGDYKSSPPLIELANLNILHYQKTSDFDNWCHMCCVPLLWRKLDPNAPKDEDVKVIPIGPTIMISSRGQYADLKYVEVSGAGLDTVQTRIKEIEKQMARLGVETMAPTKAVEKTATQVISEEGANQSPLAIAAKNLENAAKHMFYYFNLYFTTIGFPSIPDELMTALQLNIDYNKLTFSINQMLFFQGLVDKGLMSIQTFLDWLPKVTEMPKDFNALKEIEKIKSEADLRTLIQTITGKQVPEPTLANA